MEKNPNFVEFFFEFFLVSGKLHSAEKCKTGPLGVFERPFFCQIGKNEEGTLWRHFKKIAKKVSPSRKKLHKKFLVMGGTRTHVLLLGRHQKLS